MTPAPVVPTLRGQRLRLRPLKESDAPVLHAWVSDTTEVHLWRNQLGPPPYELFCQDLKRWVQEDLLHLVAEDLSAAKPIGWFWAYGYRALLRTSFVAGYVVPEARGAGVATEAGILFLDYLFLGSVPLNKVSADVYAYNEISLRMARKGGFQVEGVLRQERY